MKYEEIIQILKNESNSKNVAGMARFGISSKNTLGISITFLRPLAKRIGKDHALAAQLWDSGIHEGRILAAFIDEKDKVTSEQMERWVKEIDSWDVCDQLMSGLFEPSNFALQKAIEWVVRDEEFVKRAGFVLIAYMAVHRKKETDQFFIDLLPLLVRGSIDPRNFVRKAVNWALRQIGKRKSRLLLEQAIATAQEIGKIDSKSAQWIAKDALRELLPRLEK